MHATTFPSSWPSERFGDPHPGCRKLDVTMSKKVIWARNIEIQLIQEVRERPILWDISHPKYNRTDLKAIYWDKVAEALGSQITSNLAKERFENLRTTFMRNEKKIKDSTSSGKGTDDIYIPKWDLYPLLTFLKKTTAQAISISNLDVNVNSAAMSINSKENESVNISNIYFDENLQKWIIIPEDTQRTETEIIPSISSLSEISESNLSSSPNSTSILSQSPSDPYKPASAVTSALNIPISTKCSSFNNKIPITGNHDMYSKRGRKSSSNSCVMEEAIAAIKDLSKEETPEADVYDHFGAYVAGQLRVLTTEQRAYCEEKIVKILTRQCRS